MIKIIDGLFLIFLSISGNFIGETLSCQTQKLLTTSVFAKQLLTYTIILFTINFSDKTDNNPLIEMAEAFGVYIMFILFTKMNITPTIFVFSFLVLIYLMNNYIKYYESKIDLDTDVITENEYYENKIEMINKIIKVLMVLIIITVLFGSFYYYNEKRAEYKKSFSYMKYIFGTLTCKNI